MSLSWLRGAHFILWFALFDYWLITRRGRSLTQYPWTLLGAVFLLNLPFAIGRLLGWFDTGSSCIASFLQSENSAQQLFIYKMILSVSAAVIAVGLMQAIRRRLTLMGHVAQT